MSDEAVGVEVGGPKSTETRSKLFRGRKTASKVTEPSEKAETPAPVAEPLPKADKPTIVYIPARRRG